MAPALRLIVCSAALARERSDPVNDVALFYEAFNRRDATLFHKILSESWADIPPAPAQPAGPQGAKQIFAELTTAFPDLTIRIDEVLQAGDKVVVRSEIAGTQRSA